jgi:N-methylhydantoinase A
MHEARYGHRLAAAVELVNLRASLSGPESGLSLAPATGGPAAAAVAWLSLSGIEQPVAHFERGALALGQRLFGPALITEMAATTWLAPGWQATLDAAGNLMLERSGTS